MRSTNHQALHGVRVLLHPVGVPLTPSPSPALGRGEPRSIEFLSVREFGHFILRSSITANHTLPLPLTQSSAQSFRIAHLPPSDDARPTPLTEETPGR